MTPSGEVKFLDHLLDGGGLEVFTFDSDGDLSDQTKLNVPPNLEAIDFMVSEDGLVFLTGYYDQSSPASQQGNLFEGVFDRSGVLRKQIQPDALKKVDLKNAPLLGNKTASWAVDGNFYVLRPDEVLVVSENGVIVRRLPYTVDKATNPTSRPITVSTAAGLVSIGFMNLDEKKNARLEYLVLDAASGAAVGYYLSPEGTGSGFAACLSGRGYTFLARDKRGLKLITAGLD